jgi:hypothetical protein
MCILVQLDYNKTFLLRNLFISFTYLAFCSSLFDNAGHLLCGGIKITFIEDVKLLFFASDHFTGNIAVSALEAQNHRLGELVLLVGFNNGSSKMVATQNTTENINKDGLNLVISIKKFQCFG